MKPNSITIDDVLYVRAEDARDISDISIIRCRNAGVHMGTVTKVGETTVIVEGSRRLWRWWSDFTLSELATYGPHQDHLGDNRYGCVLPTLTLMTSDVCEIIPCTKEAAEKLYAIPDYKAS